MNNTKENPADKSTGFSFVSFRHYRCQPQDTNSIAQHLQNLNISFASFDRYPDSHYWRHFFKVYHTPRWNTSDYFEKSFGILLTSKLRLVVQKNSSHIF